MSTLNWTTLVDSQTLHTHLNVAPLRLIDCRFVLGQPQAGRAAWQAAHLPGAHYADLEQDLAAPVGPGTGRHPLPDVDQLSAKLSAWGIDAGTQVVAYDADNGAMAASRLWWLLRWLGHQRVAVLNGGFKAWQAAGLPMNDAVPAIASARFQPSPRHDFIVTADQVRAVNGDTHWRVLDARAPERYAGLQEPLDPVAGHIPGALNHPFTRNLHADGTWRSANELQDQWQRELGDIDANQVISSCGSGVTACHNLLALEVAGMTGAKLYAGSWSQWCTLTDYPIAIGSTP